jgi:hypothetical protein
MGIVTSSPRRAGHFTAAVMTAAHHHRRRFSPAVLRIPADQMPPLALQRLRHPSCPPHGFLARWDPTTMTAIWQPCPVPR